MLIHYYGYTEADILRLSVAQLNSRLKDVAEIQKMMAGEGKGRIKRDAEFIKRRIADKKLIIPARVQ